jgi:hypothetical protein
LSQDDKLKLVGHFNLVGSFVTIPTSLVPASLAIARAFAGTVDPAIAARRVCLMNR